MRFLPLLFLSAALAFQFPFKLPFFNAHTTQIYATPIDAPPSKPRVAIIGAGPGGSSAAFWISLAKARSDFDAEIDVYERSDYIGGRSTIVYPYDDPSLPELEIGASIFINANKNLWRASDEFNLTRRDFQDEDYELGIWDGEKILLTYSGSMFDQAKMLLRYGYFSIKRTDALVTKQVEEFLTLYNSTSPKWDKITDLAKAMNTTNLIEQPASEYFLSQKIGAKYIYEFIEGATRVNYGQNMDEIHGLGAAVSMAASGAVGIAGGNRQLFEQFLNRSGANVYLNATVSQISRKSNNSPLWTIQSTRGSTNYDAVILAAPYHFTNITIPDTISDQIPNHPYVHLHVTLLTTTTTTPNATYFALSNSASAPRMMLTTHDGARNGGKEPEFNSLSYHGQVREGEWAVKIFSKAAITDEWLSEMFGTGNVKWVYRKEWDAYPKLLPGATYAPTKLDQGLYYVNAFEPYVSTMETETVSSRNAVDLMLHDEFDSSICRAQSGAQDPENFVLGWDCPEA